jgi:hypothetical protein
VVDFLGAYEKALDDNDIRAERVAAYGMLLDDLSYPQAKDGSIVDLSYFKAIVGYHLIRCGWRPHPTRAQIKSRRVTGPGVIEDAIEWVSVNEPDDPLANLADMTMAQIAALPTLVHAEAMRRLGFTAAPVEPTPGWTVTPNINISDGVLEDDDEKR